MHWAAKLTIRKEPGFPHEEALSPKMSHLIALTPVKNTLVWFPLVAFVSIIPRRLSENSTPFHCFLFNKDIWLARTMLLLWTLKVYLELGPFLLVCIKICYWSPRGANISVFCNTKPNYILIRFKVFNQGLPSSIFKWNAVCVWHFRSAIWLKVRKNSQQCSISLPSLGT